MIRLPFPALMAVLGVLRKYSLVIAFPAFTVTTIWADYSHTQRWKRSILDKLKNQENLS